MIEIKSFNQILGNMVRKIVAETPLSDVNPGSVLLSLLEAAASNDFENNVAILNVLELLNVDSIRNSDLDNKAADLGLTRRSAVSASGTVTIFNGAIQKQSTNLYSLKPAPIAGQTTLFVANTDGWAPSGTLYLGRGTPSFEGPIPYVSIQRFATYSQIELGAALQKDHLSSDVVINSQGQPDRLIPAGTVVKIPANNQNPEVLYSTLRDAVIPAGEDRVEGVLVVADVPGSRGNALVNTVRRFDSVPFPGATVTNTQAFTNGADVETDAQLRNRIKSYTASLARGTAPAILNAIIGLADPDDNKRVSSAILSNPIEFGAPSILYVDDGTGFQPSYEGQAVDTLIRQANGTEEFVQLANYPLPRPQVTNHAIGPYEIKNRMFLRVAVDGEEDTVEFLTRDFVNITAATAAEIVAAINDKATLFKARLDANSTRILLYPVEPTAETLQVVPLRGTDDSSLYANHILNFPTKESSYIALYRNSTRLRQKAKKATVQTTPFAVWSLLTDGNLILSVDGTPAQNGAFTLADFPNASSYNLLTIEDWVDAINHKFAGITAESTPGQVVKISSNRVGDRSSIEVLGGSYKESMFGSNPVSDVGQESQFEINRQTGSIRLLEKLESGDTVSAGISDAKGYVTSTSVTANTFNLDSDDNGRGSQLVIVADATKCNRIALGLQVGDTFAFSTSGDLTRITANTLNAFRNVQPGHFIYLAPRDGWSEQNTGLFRVVACGPNTTPSVDSYIEVFNISAVPETVTVLSVDDVVAFETDAYPQIWNSDLLSSPSVVTLTELVESINQNIQGIKASIFRTSSIRFTSTTEKDGSIAIPVSVGRIAAIIPATTLARNNEPLIAYKVPQGSTVGFPEMRNAVSGNSYLSRSAYSVVGSKVGASDAGSTLTLQVDNISPDEVDPSNVVMFAHGDNKGLLRTINVQPTDSLLAISGANPKALFDHIKDKDDVILLKSLSFSADDRIVCVMDDDAETQTMDIGLARTGRINSGSSGDVFIPTSTEFSADDIDNEEGIDFGTLSIWGTDVNGTDFSDYAILMRARNWYASGGTESGAGKFIVRSNEFGPNGEGMRFRISYPSLPDQQNRTDYTETPSYGLLTYYFGSGPRRDGVVIAGGVSVAGPYSNPTINFPKGAADSGNYWDVSLEDGTFEGVQIGDVLSILDGALSGVGVPLGGQFWIHAVEGNTVRIFSTDPLDPEFIVLNSALINVFPLKQTSVSDIVSSINASNVLTAAAIGDDSAIIYKSTEEDQYDYVSNATALAYGHNPNQAELRGSIKLFDGINWIRQFGNANPNFVTKTPFTLTASGVSSSIYSLNSAPNEDDTFGELFKLVPTTKENVLHHLTQRAMSQLPILSDVNLSNKGKQIQIATKQLGSRGGIQVLGGDGNQAQTDIIGDSIVAADSTGSYLSAHIGAFPNTYSTGDVVKIQNRFGSRRLSRLGASDTIDVRADGSGFVEYLWNPRVTHFGPNTGVTIEDVSQSEYSMAEPGMIFRWKVTDSNGESLATVREGDVVAAYNMGPQWSWLNLAKVSGDGRVSGLPIIKVDDDNRSFDVVCPNGAEMQSSLIGAGKIAIYPTPRIKWNLAHQAPVSVSTISRNNNIVTVTCANGHRLDNDDSVTLLSSTIIADGNYGPITVISSDTFVFQDDGVDAIEPAVGATILPWNTLLDPGQTRYRLETLGVNNLVRLACVGGSSPRFRDAGVAVDDYLVISGKTFSPTNNGTFRVLAVDNDSILFENEAAVDNITDVTLFNDSGIEVTWTTNSLVVTGPVGAFKNVALGDSVKKQEDDDSRYAQVTSFNTGNSATATSITLNKAYTGISGASIGVSYDQRTDFETGVLLRDIDDITIYEGDAALKGDKLFVQKVQRAGWFSTSNTGDFHVTEVGTFADHRPFIRVDNPAGLTEANVQLANNASGFYVAEGETGRFHTYRLIAHSAVNALNNLRRSLYMVPDSRSYKISAENGSYVTHTGKLGFDLNTEIGTDGYIYYTGLLRRVQRTIDGYSPDPVTFPERRAIGSRIEALPPLIRNLTLSLTITTSQGTTIQDIVNNVKSVIIEYVNSLGVGQDVILSAVVAKVMQINGVAAVTFTVPAASQERISIAANEKAIINTNNISIN